MTTSSPVRTDSALTCRALLPVVEGLAAIGVRAAPLLAASGLPPEPASTLDEPLPRGAMARLWAIAESMTRDPDLGLHLALAAPLASFDLHAYSMLSSATLRDAFRRACRLQRLINAGGRLELDEGPEIGVVRHALAGGRPVPRQQAEFLAATWLRLGREAVGCDWVPVRARFAHPPPARQDEHRRLFGPRVEFLSGATALHVSAADLDRRNPRADDALATLLDRYGGDLLARRPADDSMAERLRYWLSRHLDDGTPTARLAARALATSERSLHRALAAEGTRFSVVLERLRRERATELLRQRRHSMAEVAFLLGFADASSFHRAYRRWTGRSPGSERDRDIDSTRGAVRSGSAGQRN